MWTPDVPSNAVFKKMLSKDFFPPLFLEKGRGRETLIGSFLAHPGPGTGIEHAA